MKSTIEAKRQDSDEKMKNLTEYLTAITTSMMDHINVSKYSPEEKYPPKDQDPTTVVPDNKRVPPLTGAHYIRIGGMCTLKHEIRSPKFYELIIKT